MLRPVSSRVIDGEGTGDTHSIPLSVIHTPVTQTPRIRNIFISNDT